MGKTNVVVLNTVAAGKNRVTLGFTYPGLARQRQPVIAEIRRLYKDMGVGDVSIVCTDISVDDPELKDFIGKSVVITEKDTAADVIAKVNLTIDFWNMTNYRAATGFQPTSDLRQYPVKGPKGPDGQDGPDGPVGPKGPKGTKGTLHDITEPDSFVPETPPFAPHDIDWTMRDTQKNVAVMFNAEHAKTVVVSPEIAADVIELVPGFVVIKQLYVFPELEDDFKNMFHAKPVPDRDYVERQIDAYSTLHGLADIGTVDTRRMVQQIVKTRFLRTGNAEDNLPSKCLADSVVWALGNEDLKENSQIYMVLPAYFYEMGLRKNDKDAFVGIRYLSETDPVSYTLDAQRQATYDRFVSAA